MLVALNKIVYKRYETSVIYIYLVLKFLNSDMPIVLHV
jgi:hypothetical protein